MKLTVTPETFPLRRGLHHQPRLAHRGAAS